MKYGLSLTPTPTRISSLLIITAATKILLLIFKKALSQAKFTTRMTFMIIIYFLMGKSFPKIITNLIKTQLISIIRLHFIYFFLILINLGQSLPLFFIIFTIPTIIIFMPPFLFFSLNMPKKIFFF